MAKAIKRCINIDWLELYCLEDYIGFPHDAEYFRRAGFSVREREYGTPVYHEMFTLLDSAGEPYIEIRRKPKSVIGHQVNGVLPERACHIRLANRTCYFNEPVRELQLFIERYGLAYQRISRVDICNDFVTFDWGDDPAKFMRRYMQGVYSKINQANISAHGRDDWHGRVWNSVSWGNEKSMVSTKFYNKKLELQQVRDKPYIRQAWRACGLVDDDLTLVKYDDNGKPTTPDIWRVEFSIKSGTRNWFMIENNQENKRGIRSVRNTLNMYDTKDKLLTMFLSLADHYFHFKYFEENVRKDRCADKLLFNTKAPLVRYKLETVKKSMDENKSLERLYNLISDYAQQRPSPSVYKASCILLEDIATKQRTGTLTYPWDTNELTLLRLLIAKRIKSHDLPLSQDKEVLESMIGIERDLFGELTEK